MNANFKSFRYTHAHYRLHSVIDSKQGTVDKDKDLICIRDRSAQIDVRFWYIAFSAVLYISARVIDNIAFSISQIIKKNITLIKR